MKSIFIITVFTKKGVLSVAYALLSFMTTVSVWGQNVLPLDRLKEDPRRAYGTDYPYKQTDDVKLTKAPSGYKPFYISHYARHGSRYSWSSSLYDNIDTVLTVAHMKHLLTPAGEDLLQQFMAVKEELLMGVSELTELGWQQHQGIARTMYNNFPEVFKKGGNVLAISSQAGRCVMSMSAFCQELVQCNPKIEIREQASRFFQDGVVPDNKKFKYPENLKPRYEKNRNQFQGEDNLNKNILGRVFTSTEGLPLQPDHIAGELIGLYKSLPSIGHEGMMGDLITDQEIADRWEGDNLGAYSWLFGSHLQVIPILQDILKKAAAAIDGTNNCIADLRFGHDGHIGPLTILMGINGADLDPEDPYEVKNCYQSWETCKASNIQLIFYRSKKQPDNILVKCLMNGEEATLPVPTTSYPYYKWSDFLKFYTKRCEGVVTQ